LGAWEVPRRLGTNKDLDLKTMKAEEEPTEGEGKLRAVKLGISKGIKRKGRLKIREEVN